jgi:hypothetical protein
LNVVHYFTAVFVVTATVAVVIAVVTAVFADVVTVAVVPP